MPQPCHSGRVQVRRFRMIFTILVSLLSVPGVLSAADPKSVVIHATGSITFRSPCPTNPALLCQGSIVSGIATRLGPLTGVLNESVDLTNFPNGTYVGTGVFTMANGDTFSTMSTGQVTLNPDGAAVFSELHQISSGTGKYSGTTGTFQVAGTAAADGSVVVDGGGSISR
jgi:hypothetical protein